MLLFERLAHGGDLFGVKTRSGITENELQDM
jgi:hypothetical protein